MKPVMSKKTLDKNVPLEALIDDQDGVMPHDKIEWVDAIGGDAIQEDTISDFEEITGILDPHPTITPTRRSKRLSEKRGGRDY